MSTLSPDDSESRTPRGHPRRDRGGGFVAGVVAVLFAVAVVIFLLQNGRGVEVRWLAWTVTAPLWLIAFVAAGASALLTTAVLVTRRSRRRQ